MIASRQDVSFPLSFLSSLPTLNVRTTLVIAMMRSATLSYAGGEEPHFLEACTLCSKPLGHNSDIFMYRGNTPFCSQECRQEQIEIDEAREKRWRVSSSSSKKSAETTKKSATSSKANVQTGTLVVA